MLTIPRREIRHERKRRGWSQDTLADKMTALRDAQVKVEYPPYTFQVVARIETGRAAVRFDDENEPLWWAVVVLGMPPTCLLG